MSSKEAFAVNLLPRLQKRGPIEAICLSALYASTFASSILPRLQKRGPIEATMPATPSDTPWSTLPRLQKRGPIEAELAADWTVYKDRLPRLQKRGPIEATTSIA